MGHVEGAALKLPPGWMVHPGPRRLRMNVDGFCQLRPAGAEWAKGNERTALRRRSLHAGRAARTPFPGGQQSWPACMQGAQGKTEGRPINELAHFLGCPLFFFTRERADRCLNASAARNLFYPSVPHPQLWGPGGSSPWWGPGQRPAVLFVAQYHSWVVFAQPRGSSDSPPVTGRFPDHRPARAGNRSGHRLHAPPGYG